MGADDLATVPSELVYILILQSSFVLKEYSDRLKTSRFLVKLPFQLRQVTYLLVFVALICLVLYLKKIFFVENMYIVLSCLTK